MGKKKNILFGLLTLVTTLTPVNSESEQGNKVKGISGNISRLESEKSIELLLEEKSHDEVQESAEKREQRSSDDTSNPTVASDKFKSVINNPELQNLAQDNIQRSAPDDTNEKSVEMSRYDNKSSLNFDKDTEDLESEKFITNIDGGLNLSNRDSNKNSMFDNMDEKTINEDDKSQKNLNGKIEDFNENSGEVEIDSGISRSVLHESQDALLDSKVRTAESSFENPENVDNSGLGVMFGSRRSYTDTSTSSVGLVSLGRSGSIFNEAPLPIADQNSLQFSKINTQDTILPNGFLGNGRPPVTFYNKFSLQNLPQKPYDPYSSIEFKPIEEMNADPFSNAYPYAYNPKASTTTSTQNPVETNHIFKIPTDFFAKFPASTENFKIPRVKLIADNLQTVSFKSPNLNLPFTAFNSFIPKIRISNQPHYYRQQCSFCG